MPKILQINVTANWGSTGRIAEQINKSAFTAGWSCWIAYSRHKKESQSMLIKIGTKFDVVASVIEAHLLDRGGLSMRKATNGLIKKIKEVQPDIIHLHNIHGYVLNYQILFEYLNQTRIKVVWTFHDFWAMTGHCAHFVDVNCDKWKTTCHECPKSLGYPKSYIDFSQRNHELKRKLFTANKNLHIVAVSEWVANYVRASFFKNNKISVIHNGVDLSVFRSIQTKNDKRFSVIAVSNVWTRSKGLYDIYKLRELLPDEIEIKIVGLSGKQVRNLPTGIDGITRTQNIDELVKLYSQADVLINPTYADSFPTVNLEALACGTPVITYDTGGSPETIDKYTGIVIPQGDVKVLSEAIIKIKDNPMSSEKCRERAEMYFDKDKCFHRYIELYEELLKRKE